MKTHCSPQLSPLQHEVRCVSEWSFTQGSVTVICFLFSLAQTNDRSFLRLPWRFRCHGFPRTGPRDPPLARLGHGGLCGPESSEDRRSWLCLASGKGIAVCLLMG